MFKLNNNSHIIVIVSVITGISLLGDSMLYITLPIYLEDVGLDSIWQVGILLSINRFIRLPFSPIVGWIYSKISLKTGLMIAILLGSFTTLGYGVFNGFLAWIILRALWGIAWSFFRIGGLSIVATAAEENNGKSIGLYNGIYRLGSLIGMLAGGLLVPILGIDLVSIIFGCLTLIGLPLILLFINGQSPSQVEVKGKETKTEKRPFIQRLQKKYLMIIFTGFCITMLFQGIFTSTLSPVIENHYGEIIYLFGTAVSVTFFSGVLQSARWVWEPFLGVRFGHWSDGAKGRMPILILTLTITSLIFWTISMDLPLFLFITNTFLVLIAATSLTTVVDAIALDFSKKTNEVSVSFLTSYSIAQDFEASIGPFISFMLIELENGFSYIYFGSSVLFFVLALLWFISSNGSFKQSPII